MALQETLGGRGRRKKLKEETALDQSIKDAKSGLYHCNYCRKDISHVPRIKCAVCKDFDLCLECFSVGVEIKPHKKTHDYQVVENLSFPIFHPDWGTDEEMLLLEAIDQCGLGNWVGIAEHLGTKTPAQCKEHYFRVYIDVDTYPLPTPTPEMDMVDKEEVMRRARLGYPRAPWQSAAAAGGEAAGGAVEARAGSEPPAAGTPSLDLTMGMEEPSRPMEGGGTPGPTGPAPDEATGTGAGEAAPMDVAEGAGPGPSSDAVLGDLSAPVPGASPGVGKGMKRHRHEQHVAEEGAGGAGDAEHAAGSHAAHAVVGGRSMHHEAPPPVASTGGKAPRQDGADGSGGGKAGSYDPTGFHAKRFEFDPEFDNDAECIVADMEFSEHDNPHDVQLKVQMLQLYNRRLDERERRRAIILERGLLKTHQADRRRNPQERDLHARMRVFARYQPQPLHEELVEGLLQEARMRSRIAELKEYRRSGIRTFADAETHDTERRRQKAAADAALLATTAVHGGPVPYASGGRGAGGAAAKAARAAAAAASSGLSGFGGLPGMDDGSAPGSLASVPAAAASTASTASTTYELSRPAVSMPMGRGAGAALAAWRFRRGAPLDVAHLPGVELLSSRERELCAGLRLLPPHYLALEDMLLRDCEGSGPVTRQEAKTYFRLEPARALRIYDMITSAGWIKGGGGGPAGVAGGPGGGGPGRGGKHLMLGHSASAGGGAMSGELFGGGGYGGSEDGDEATGADPMDLDER